MSTYSAADIVGNNLVAKKNVKLFRVPDKNSTPVYEVGPGENVGVVYSYIKEKNGQPLFWMFYDDKGKTYYSIQAPGVYSIESLKNQGVKTLQEKQKEKEESEKDGWDKAKDIVVNVGIFALLTSLVLKAAR